MKYYSQANWLFFLYYAHDLITTDVFAFIKVVVKPKWVFSNDVFEGIEHISFWGNNA